MNVNPKVEIVCIGNELLSGQVLNTNAYFLSGELKQLGIDVSRHTVLQDERFLLSEGLKECFQRSDWILCTGGLGSTLDDRTKEVVFELLGLPKDATGDVLFSNLEGIEQGIGFIRQGKLIILLPGVPKEMEVMVQSQVIHYLKSLLKGESFLDTQSIHFCLLTEEEIDPVLRKIQKKWPELDIGIYPSYEKMTIVITSKDRTSIQKGLDVLRNSFPSYEIENKQGSLALAIQELFLEKRKTLALAESCTGGFMSHILTSQPGSSDYFLGSFVTYSNQLKEKILLVDSETLNRYGAVSAQTVEKMWQGIFQVSSADFGIAVSGIAGPSGGSEENPVGTVFFALGERGKSPDVGSFRIIGGRNKVVFLTSYNLLSFLYRKLNYNISI